MPKTTQPDKGAALQPFTDQLSDALTKCNHENPAKADVDRLRSLLDAHPEIWARIGNMATQIEGNLLAKMPAVQAMREISRVGAEALRRDLGYGESTALERILIDQVVICWLKQSLAEQEHTDIITGSVTLTKALFQEKKLTESQRRYLRAVETLAKVRRLLRLGPPVQVNVAASGGQQINVAS